MKSESLILPDSGSRRAFESGAVRDMAVGKGRCDLLPIVDMVDILEDTNLIPFGTALNNAISTKDSTNLQLQTPRAFTEFAVIAFGDLETAFLELSKLYEAGCLKYGDRNWEKGLPIYCFFDSAIRHFLKWKRGDDDERHDRAVLWNLVGARWTARTFPELFIKYIGGDSSENQ